MVVDLIMKPRLARAALVLVSAFALGMADVPGVTAPVLYEIGVWELPLALSPSLEGRREYFEEMLLAAQRRIRDFSRRHKWQRQTATPLALRAAIYEDKAKFDLALIRLLGATATKRIPRTQASALARGTLVLAAPEVYKDLAEAGIETDSYEKLMAHELAHGLHSRLLDGNDELVGPEWFREGFAVHAAGQYELLQIEPAYEEIYRIVNGNSASPQAYGAAFRHFARRVPLQDLIKRAYLPTFKGWLLQLETAGQSPGGT